MSRSEFDAEKFVRDLDAGKYDDAIHEEIKKLSIHQLRAVAETLIRAREGRDTSTRPNAGDGACE
jgi:hypothetical protein